jgi:predicted aminopeptidase
MELSIGCRLIVFLIAALMLLGCQSAGYYAQAIWGQAQMVMLKRPVDELLEDPETPRAVKEKLAYVMALREFARKELQLPVGGAYSSYTDIAGSYVIWNVFAAPEFSLEPKMWCYPVIGCASYRGYFSHGNAEEYANSLRRDGFDVFVTGVTAYSTIGWFDDPVLGTFLRLDKARLSALIFHELAHRVLYVAGDTEFNESFATMVEEEGMRRWAMENHDPEIFCEQERRMKFQKKVIERVAKLRHELQVIYASHLPAEQKKNEKCLAFRAFLDDLESERQTTKPKTLNSRQWFESGLNNATLVPLAAYHDLAPAFHRILKHLGGDLAAFYLECRRLAELSPTERKAYMQRLMPLPSSIGN